MTALYSDVRIPGTSISTESHTAPARNERTSNTAVPSNALDPLLARRRDEPLLQLVARLALALQAERDVHPTPASLLRRADVEIGVVDEVVDEGGFGGSESGEGGEGAGGGAEGKGRSFEKGTEDEGTDVDGEGGRGAAWGRISDEGGEMRAGTHLYIESLSERFLYMSKEGTRGPPKGMERSVSTAIPEIVSFQLLAEIQESTH